MGSLKDRLARHRAIEREHPGQAATSKKIVAPVTINDWSKKGWRQVTEGVYECINKYTLSTTQASALLEYGYYTIHSYIKVGSVEQCVFFDLETTGLSGGAGTVAFLAAVGFINQHELTIHQLFLLDFPFERAFLERLLVFLSSRTVIVSYNGKSYDLPLLRTRCAVQGVPIPDFRHHLDLVHPARALWRGIIPDCSLLTVEQEILNKFREHDIPGQDIPDVWFGFLRQGSHPDLDTVFLHNAEDIRSLADLLVFVNERVSRRAIFSNADIYGQARLMARIDHRCALGILDAVMHQPQALDAKTLRLVLWLQRRILPSQEYRTFRKNLLEGRRGDQ